jgi:hypothetical protein
MSQGFPFSLLPPPLRPGTTLTRSQGKSRSIKGQPSLAPHYKNRQTMLAETPNFRPAYFKPNRQGPQIKKLTHKTDGRAHSFSRRQQRTAPSGPCCFNGDFLSAIRLFLNYIPQAEKQVKNIELYTGTRPSHRGKHLRLLFVSTEFEPVSACPWVRGPGCSAGACQWQNG